MLRYQVRTDTRRIRVHDYVRDFVDVPRFLTFCRACPSYGETWACPEFDFDPQQVWAGHRWLHLTAYFMEFAPDQSRTGFVRDELIDEVRSMFYREKRHAHRELMRLRSDVPGSYPLSAGGCDLCAQCTRKDGLPCRIPDQLVHSIESLGGDVQATMANLFDRPILWSDGTSLPDYFVMLMGLLSDQDRVRSGP